MQESLVFEQKIERKNSSAKTVMQHTDGWPSSLHLLPSIVKIVYNTKKIQHSEHKYATYLFIIY